MSARITFHKLYPLPGYEGPRPVYRAQFPWAGAVTCLVRRNGDVWETAPFGSLSQAKFSPCPVADASSTRLAAVMAFDYYHHKETCA